MAWLRLLKAGMAESVDATVSKTVGGNLVRVRLPLPAAFSLWSLAASGRDTPSLCRLESVHQRYRRRAPHEEAVAASNLILKDQSKDRLPG